jgi:branched-chain amino acid aminotransferase
MLDNLGFVSETNACNIFMVSKGSLFTPNADACLPGITRSKVIQLAQQLQIPIFLKNISIAEFYNADEVFTTGTMGELTPVYEIDGRVINNKSNTTIREQLYKAYKQLTETEGEKII